jgi:hypothetical protein
MVAFSETAGFNTNGGPLGLAQAASMIQIKLVTNRFLYRFI